MAEPAVRAFAMAGVLATGLFFGGITAAPVFADPGDSGGSSDSGGGSGDSGGGSTSGGSGSDSTGGDSSSSDDSSTDTGTGSATAPEVHSTPDEPPAPAPEPTGAPDTSTREIPGASESAGGSVVAPPAKESQKTGYDNSISIPFVRLPAPGEVPAGTLPPPSTFYTTVEIPIPSLTQFLQALQILPPSPAPVGPAFRTQEEAPIVDSTTGTTTGGGGGGRTDAPVFRAPLVVAVPRALTLAGAAPRLPEAAPVPGGGGNGFTQPGVAGVRTAAVRGSVPATPGVTADPAVVSPMGRPAVRESGYARGLTSPTVAEIAAVALPGVAGLMFLTFSGGFIGYRQANSLRFVRTAGAERFLP
jgi:hypothetical protein